LQMAQTYISALCDLLERGKRWCRDQVGSFFLWSAYNRSRRFLYREEQLVYSDCSDRWTVKCWMSRVSS
jgi:hypothetical protein